MRAAYEGSSVDLSACALTRLLEIGVNPVDFVMGVDEHEPSADVVEPDTLQPMVVTPAEIHALVGEMASQREQREAQYKKGKEGSRLLRKKWFKGLYRRLMPKRRESAQESGKTID